MKLLVGVDADPAALLGALELHLAIDDGENREVTPQADADTRMKFRAALAYENVSGSDNFAAVLLHAAKLRLGVATVAR